MSHRRLVIVTYHFPPSAASGTHRLLGFARHLPRQGWQTSVIAPASLPWEPTDERLLERVPPDVIVHTVPYPRARVTKLFRRFAKFGVWLPPALRMLRNVITRSRPDAVLTSGPPHCVHALGWYAKRVFGLSWAADFRDPWIVGDPQEHWRSLRVRLARRWERVFLRNADLVVSNAPRARTVLETAYPEFAKKISTITNGFDAEGFPKRIPRDPDRPEIRIVHAGEIYCGRDPRPFLDAVNQLRKEDEALARSLRTRFLGRASEGAPDLETEIRSRGLSETVTADGQVSYDLGRRAMAEADILLLLDSPGRKVGVPAKLYEYLGAGAAILALAEQDGDTAWVLRQSGLLHRIVPPLRPDLIPVALKALIANVRRWSNVKFAQNNLAAFTRAATAGQLAEHLNRMLPLQSARSGKTPSRIPTNREMEPAVTIFG